MMSDKPLTEGVVRHQEKPLSTSKPISPPPSGKPKKECCGGGCHDKKSKKPKKQGRCLKDGGCDGEPQELKCIHDDAVYAAFVMVIVTSAVFGVGLGISLFAISTGSAIGIIILGLVAMLIGGCGSVAMWSTLSDGIKVYKKIMKED